MRLPIIWMLFLLGSVTTLQAQETRAHNGTNNNIANPTWGSANSALRRVTPTAYQNGISTPSGNDRPNAREVSNALFAQDSPLNDPRNLSDYCWVFGQFMDHDITAVPDGPTFLYVSVPQGDEHFDPWNTGFAVIPMRRSMEVEGTGNGTNVPREHPNAITSFIDGSNVYGSDSTRAAWLRLGYFGKLNASGGDLLPYNTIDGGYDSDIDDDAPHMDDATGQLQKFFVAGDARANENVLLASFHTLFMREHNRLCDSLVALYPSWSDDQLYEHARRINSGFIQAITYEQWLPAMGVHLPAYTGYDPSVNPSVTNLFSGAAFRLGHTLLSSEIVRMDMDGEIVSQGNLSLKDAFFNPLELFYGGGLEPLFKGMATQVQQDCDGRVIDDIRNFLFGEPGAGGLDLASINIERGRERGFADFNTIRNAFGLPSYTDFETLTGDAAVATILTDLGYTINNIDPWVGFLVEEHMPDALFGETLMAVMAQQFNDLRAGDRFFYENDPALSAYEKQVIRNTMLGDIIRRNTEIPIMQENVFFAMPHDMLVCGASAPFAQIAGGINTEEDAATSGVTMEVVDADNTSYSVDATNGNYAFEELPTCATYEITPSKDTGIANGVTTADLVKMRRHVLGVEFLDSPYKIIAADVNNSGGVTTSDLVEVRKVILTINTAFPNNTSWRFVASDYVFNDPTNPLAETFPESITTNSLQEDMANIDFVAVKIGDVNTSANPNNAQDDDNEERGNDVLAFTIEDEMLNEGELHTVAFKAADIQKLGGFQFTLNYNTEHLDFVQLRGGALPKFTTGNFFPMPQIGAITMSWDGETENIEADAALFSVTFKAKKGVHKICEVMTINSRYTKAEAYERGNDTGLDMGILFNCMDGPMLVHNKFEVYQNFPNPVQSATTFGFYMPEDGAAQITVFDQAGRTLYNYENTFTKGANEMQLNRADINASGVVYYRVATAFGEATKKMVLVE